MFAMRKKVHRMRVLLRRRSRTDLPDRQAGFSFFELLVSVGILAIIATISSVSWIGYQREQALDAAGRDILNALHEAQGQALGRVDIDGDGTSDQFGVRIVNQNSGRDYLEYFHGATYDAANVIRRTNFEPRVDMTCPCSAGAGCPSAVLCEAGGSVLDFVYEARSGKLDLTNSTPLDPDCPNTACGGECRDIELFNLVDSGQQATLRVWEHGGTEIDPAPLMMCP